MKTATDNSSKSPIGQRRKNFSEAVSRRNRRRDRHQKLTLWPVIHTDIVIASIILATVSFLFVDNWVGTYRGMIDSTIVDAFRMITDIGKSEWILIPTGVFCLLMVFVDWQVLARRQRVWLSGLLFDAWFLFLSVAGSGLIVLFLKQLAGRARPKHFEALGFDYFDPLRFESSFTSFPSGHSVTIAALATFLVLRFPKFLFPAVALALLIGSSRIIVGAHYPSDVIVGLTIGMLFTLFLARMFAARNAGYRISGDGPVEPLMPTRRIVRGLKPLNLKDARSILFRLTGISS